MLHRWVFWILLFASCADNAHDQSVADKHLPEAKSENKIDTSKLRSCIKEKDTAIDKDNSIQYVIVDSFYAVKVKVGGLDTVLNYRFNCSVPRGLVPSFFSSSKDMIRLIRGSGQHYREFIISYIDSNLLKVKCFETALTTDLDNAVVVYQDSGVRTKIVVENIRNGRQKSFVVPSRYANEVPRSSITNSELVLTFSDRKLFTFTLPLAGTDSGRK